MSGVRRRTPWALLFLGALQVSCAWHGHQARTPTLKAPKTMKATSVSKPGVGSVPTVEATDRQLSAAIAAVAIAPGAATERRLADRYRALGILDAASDHYSTALRFDPKDALAYEGLARIWRDWGFPHLGLSDASRAVYFAPSSATAHNTLGTILAALAHTTEARREYERALALDPSAAYAWNNLCHLSLQEGHAAHALDECRSALALNPDFAAARRNLASAEAAQAR